MAGDRDANQRLMRLHRLPPCEGPKLHVFEHRADPIEWVERLDDPQEESGSGYVFRVRMRQKEYALKVFKFFAPDEQRYLLGRHGGADVSDDTLAFHTDPFYAECRAYGRIHDLSLGHTKARNKNERTRGAGPEKRTSMKIATDCYGFLGLPYAETEDYLRTQGIDLWYDIDPDDDYRLAAEGSPVRAIVKEYIPPALTSPSIRYFKHILKSLRYLNESMQILHRKVNADAFHPRKGLIFSFASAWTLDPHCIMDTAGEELREAWKLADLVKFDNMLEEAVLIDKVRALPDLKYKKKLRKQTKMR